MYPDHFLTPKLTLRKESNALRTLQLPKGNIDFCSNDYLGITHNSLLTPYSLLPTPNSPSGSSGSRLLSGNYPLLEVVEKQLAAFHNSPAALLFNSGYDANLGLLSCVPQKGDTILYDQLSHASIRDGIRLSFAESFSFAHNDMADLEKKLQKATGNVFVVTESVFSMDGDLCPLAALVRLTEHHRAHLVVDEAHATGVVGEKGEGLVQHLQYERNIFARIHTFGKAVGCHGAVVLGSEQLRSYLINFSRPIMYSTSLPPHAVAMIQQSYAMFPHMQEARVQLQTLVALFQHAVLRCEKLISQTPIQGVVIPGNEEVRKMAETLQQQGFDVRPILYPTVPKGKERLRIVLHAFNTVEQLQALIQQL